MYVPDIADSHCAKSHVTCVVVCVQAIQTFLDESCNGHVSKEDWMKQFVTQYQEKKGGFKQRFL